MERVLPPRVSVDGKERTWKILVVDAYKAQITDAVKRLAWQRGFVLIEHGGGATPITQPNDTSVE